MGLPSALSGTETTRLALEAVIEANLSYVSEVEVAHATVDGDPASTPILEIATTSESANWTSAPKAGMRAKITHGSTLKGVYRVRKVPIAGTFYIDEVDNADSGQVSILSRTTGIADGDLITIYECYDLASVKPYVDSDGVIYQDREIAVGTYNATPEVIVNCTINGYPGDYATKVAAGGTQAITAVVSITKWITSTGSTLSYQWAYPAGFTGVSGATSATLTATAPVGEHWIYCTVTDSIGGAFQIARWIRIHSPSDLPIKVRIEVDTRDGAFRRVTAYGSRDRLSAIPEGAYCVIWGTTTWGGLDVSSASHTFGGYITKIDLQHRPMDFYGQVEIVGTCGILDKLQGYSAVWNFDGTTSTWESLDSGLQCLAFMQWWLLRHRVANVLKRHNFTPFDTTGTIARRKLVSVNSASAYAQLKQLGDRYRVKVGSSSDGEIFCVRDVKYLDERSAVVTRGTLTNSIYSYIKVTWRQRGSTGIYRCEGIVNGGFNADTPVIAQAPGEKNAGQYAGTQTSTDNIFESQLHANLVAGFGLADMLNEYPEIQLEIPSNYDVGEPVHGQRWIVQIPANKSPTGAALSLTCLLKNVTKQWIGGRKAKLAWQLEAETNGLPGVTVPIPPAQTTMYGTYSTTSVTQPAYTWGSENSKVVTDANGAGLLIFTQDGYVVAG